MFIFMGLNVSLINGNLSKIISSPLGQFLLNRTVAILFLMLYTVVLFLSLSSCTRDPSLFQINNLNGGEIGLFGHGGMGISYRYPMSSYESLETLFRCGGEGSDIDVQMSADKQLYLYHPKKLEESTQLSGLVNNRSAGELEAGRYSMPLFNKARLISAQYLIDRINVQDVLITFDCKLYAADNADYTVYMEHFAEALTEFIQKNGMRERCFIESNNTAFLSLLKNKDPGLKLFLYSRNFDTDLPIADTLDLYGLSTALNDVSAADVETAHAHGRRVTLWNVKNKSDNITAIQKSPDYIQSDEIIHLLKMFSKYKHQGIRRPLFW